MIELVIFGLIKNFKYGGYKKKMQSNGRFVKIHIQ